MQQRPAAVLLCVVSIISLSLLIWPGLPTTHAAGDVFCKDTYARYGYAPPTREVVPTAVSDVSAGGVSAPELLLARDAQAARLVALSNDDVFVMLDFGQVVSGRLRVQVSGGAGRLGLAVSESREHLSRSSDTTYKEHGTSLGDVAGAGELVSGQVSLRYAMLFLDGAGDIGVDAVSLEFTPMLGTADSYAGCFESSDAELNRIWYAGAYTLELNTITTPDGGPRILDGAKRDREVWVGDLALQARIEYLTHSRPEAVHASLADLADHQHPNGYIPPSSYGGYSTVLYDYAAWWVIAFADYARHTGDLTFASDYYPHLQRQMEWFLTITGPNGLLVKDQGLEWSFTLQRGGEVTYLNVLYYQALLDAVQLADQLGQAGDANMWRERASQLRELINGRLFDPARGVYLVSDQDRLRVPQDANVLAILSGVAPPEAHSGILRYLQEHLWTPYGSTTVDISYGLDSWHDKRIWPFMGYYEVEARFASGDAAGALELLRREWGHMLGSDPASTMWEWMTAGGQIENGFASLAHGWSGGATVALSERVLGVRPLAPGYATIEVAPQPGDLDWARGRVPTPHGPVDVSWRRVGAGFDMDLDVPEGTTARVSLPVSGGNPLVLVNNQPAWRDGAALAYDATRAGDVVTLELPGGQWQLSAGQDWRAFPETGQILGDAFLTFWDTHGGLPIFGYPLSPRTSERNADTDEQYPTQYLERQRFEFHAELAGTPYEVLLGRLGAEDAVARGLLGEQVFQSTTAQADPDCRFYVETGHNVCGLFRQYWEGHGLELGEAGVAFPESLALFGYPLSESFVDSSTGLVTQYFERAVFEHHPANAAPYDVLLRRLGAERYSGEQP